MTHREELDEARAAAQLLLDGWMAAIRNSTLYLQGERVAPLSVARAHPWLKPEGYTWNAEAADFVSSRRDD